MIALLVFAWVCGFLGVWFPSRYVYDGDAIGWRIGGALICLAIWPIAPLAELLSLVLGDGYRITRAREVAA